MNAPGAPAMPSPEQNPSIWHRISKRPSRDLPQAGGDPDRVPVNPKPAEPEPVSLV